MQEKEMLEERFKMRALSSMSNVNVLKEVKLFDNVFDNSDTAQFESEQETPFSSNNINNSINNNYVIYFQISDDL
jgi:hypothetical protein